MTQLIDAFIRIIEGDARDRDRLREHWERWVRDLSPGADGWVGSTAGTTDEGRFIGVMRFASTESARRNDQREEHAEWLEGLRDLLQGDVIVRGCSDVGEIAGGGSQDAGFVVVMQGRATDLQDVIHRVAETEEAAIAGRPVLLGGYVAGHEDGEGFSEILYFRSEQETDEAEERVGEEISHLRALSGYVSDVQQLRLREPWVHSA